MLWSIATVSRPTTCSTCPSSATCASTTEQFADRGNHINGIENFWNQAKRHLRRYNGIPRAHFPLYLKECEWRFNYRPANRLLATLKTWLNEARSIPI
jgi:hypothetical protein